MMEKRYLVKAFEYDELITLDRHWFSNVSGGKCHAERRYVLLTEETYQKLRAYNRTKFDYALYDRLMEAESPTADDYIEALHKDVRLSDDDYIVYDLQDITEIKEMYEDMYVIFK